MDERTYRLLIENHEIGCVGHHPHRVLNERGSHLAGRTPSQIEDDLARALRRLSDLLPVYRSDILDRSGTKESSRC